MSRFLVARDGDWIFAPFQCDKCWFVNIHGRLPRENSVSDTSTLHVIRRANLDLFWSREPRTVQGIFGHVRDIINRSTRLRRSVPLERFDPWPVGDNEGMGIAILMLEKSREPGRNAKDYQQFDTCRKLRLVAANVSSASAKGNALRFALKSTKHISHLTQLPSQTLYMEMFCKGMKARMPQVSVRNKPLVGEVVALLLDQMEAKVVHPETEPDRQRELIMTGGYIATTFGYSLRGNEGFWVDADRLRSGIGLGRYANDSGGGHVVISLMGRFKGEDGDRMHVVSLANVTKSGIRIRAWLERVVSILKEEGLTECPAFCDTEG